MLRAEQVLGDALGAVRDAALDELTEFLIAAEFVGEPDLARDFAVLHHADVVLPVADSTFERRDEGLVAHSVLLSGRVGFPWTKSSPMLLIERWTKHADQLLFKKLDIPDI